MFVSLFQHENPRPQDGRDYYLRLRGIVDLAIIYRSGFSAVWNGHLHRPLTAFCSITRGEINLIDAAIARA